MLRVLIIGGYGFFGGRLVRLLADDERLTLIAAGRSRTRADAFVAGMTAVEAAEFDRDGEVSAALAAVRPDIVVDASGPWQAYGADPYRLARAVIAAGAHYIDLADAADFVSGIAALAAEAKARGRAALSGASSFPVLSFAAVRELAKDFASLEGVEAGIAPSPRAGIGPNVIRALVSYAGKPVRYRRNGETVTAPGLIDSRRFTIAPPGRVPLGPRRFALVETPDLTLLPLDYPGLAAVWTGGGPAPALMHRLLWCLAKLAQWRIIPTLVRLAPLLSWCTRHIRWGEHRGGMVVRVTGRTSTGGAAAASWNLIAEGDSGPFIPALPAAILIRRLAAGIAIAPGARPAHGDLTLSDFTPDFTCLGIVDGIRRAEPATGPLYRNLLGEAYGRLPPPLRALHDVRSERQWSGRATVSRGSGILSHGVAKLFGFPPAGENIPVTVTLTRQNGREIWTRSFDGQCFVSTQEQGRGRFEGLNAERFGPLTFGLAMVVADEKLRLILRRWSAFGIPLPLWLAPRTDAFEHAGDGRFHFSVDIALPLTGRVVKYEGWLAYATPHEQE